MAKVVLSITDAQAELLGRLRGGEQLGLSASDPRTYTGLVKRGLVRPLDSESYWRRRYTLTEAGAAVVAALERLAILDPIQAPARKSRK